MHSLYSILLRTRLILTNKFNFPPSHMEGKESYKKRFAHQSLKFFLWRVKVEFECTEFDCVGVDKQQNK